MKKLCSVLALTLIFVLFIPITAYANMAAPAQADIGSAVTFEKNELITVLSEQLDITVRGSKADIVASYKMKNTSDESVTTQAMFLSPNIDNGDVSVVLNGVDAPYTAKSYALDYSTEIEENGWQYAVLVEQPEDFETAQTVDTILFEMSFEPGEEYDVTVSYIYRLGGYPDYDFNAKNGEIVYYLAPAAMWKDFSSLTINLRLDEDMPVISSSTLDFERLGKGVYRYCSDSLPEEELRIVIDENAWQNIFSTLRSPYLGMSLLILLPFFLIALVALAAVILIVRRIRKRKAASAHME